MNLLSANLGKISKRIKAAAERSGRQEETIKIIAVTKTIPPISIREVMDLGISSFGENRVQELVAKFDEIPSPVQWHLIGHLQRNKVKYIVDKIALIHSLDRISLAKEIDKRAARIQRQIPVLIQVNIAEEKSKFGLQKEEVIPFIQEIKDYPHLEIQGLMTMAPLVQDPEEVRPVFRSMRELRDEINALSLSGVRMKYLSMGMTNDFEIAIEEGANMVRIGSGIFGERK